MELVYQDIEQVCYRIFARIYTEQKSTICKTISSEGKLVVPHASQYILCKGNITVRLPTSARALEATYVTILKLAAYGMKALYRDAYHIDATPCTGVAIGTNCI